MSETLESRPSTLRMRLTMILWLNLCPRLRLLPHHLLLAPHHLLARSLLSSRLFAHAEDDFAPSTFLFACLGEKFKYLHWKVFPGDHPGPEPVPSDTVLRADIIAPRLSDCSHIVVRALALYCKPKRAGDSGAKRVREEALQAHCKKAQPALDKCRP